MSLLERRLLRRVTWPSGSTQKAANVPHDQDSNSAFLAGGVILNILKEELPAERESRF